MSTKKTIYLAALCERVWLLERVFDAAVLSKLHQALKKLAKHGQLRACYEASGATVIGWMGESSS